MLSPTEYVCVCVCLYFAISPLLSPIFVAWESATSRRFCTFQFSAQAQFIVGILPVVVADVSHVAVVATAAAAAVLAFSPLCSLLRSASTFGSLSPFAVAAVAAGSTDADLLLVSSRVVCALSLSFSLAHSLSCFPGPRAMQTIW